MKSARPHGIRISELARRADVPHATVQHYVREGLLRAPAKTGRTMAYYDADSVERIVLIKELQRRHLPLGVIRRLLEERGTSRENDATVMAEIGRAVQDALAPEERALTIAEVSEQLALPRDVLAELEEEGVVSSATGAFSPHDVAILRALSRLARAGLNRAAGFRAKDIAIYEDAMRNLVAAEVGKFLERASASPGQDQEVIRLGVAAATCATDLIVALRQKYIAQTLAGMAPKKKKAKR